MRDQQQNNGTQNNKDPQKQTKGQKKVHNKFNCRKICKRNQKRKVRREEGKETPLRQVVFDASKLPNNHHYLENQKYCNNRISTTKYNQQLFYPPLLPFNFSLTFLPKSMIIQFKRVSNVYFLISAILCSIPGFSPLPSYTAIMPLAFVLTMSMLREAYEDYKRRVNDRLTNNKQCRVLVGSPMSNQVVQFDQQSNNHLQVEENDFHQMKSYFKDSLWSEIKCGDFILVEEGEHFPADAVILMSSADNGECFVQTSTLDGERALKHKQCLVPIKKAIEKEGILKFHANVHCENPTKNLYEFNAFMESEQFPEQGTIQLNPQSKKRTITLDNKQLALRGSNLANTSWVIAAVIYTGKETKLMLNYGLSRFKQSKIEKVVNVICIYLILIQTVLCVIMSIYAGFYTSNYAEYEADGLKRKGEYLFYTELTGQGNRNSTSSSADDLTYNPTIVGVKTYGSYYILLNTLIPISLVVSIEFVKLIQTPFFKHDLQMYDEISMKQAQPMTMTLHEELASVRYIFADKTGTLTANIMQFKACTIGSVCYDEDYNDDDYEYEFESEIIEQSQECSSENSEERKQKEIDNLISSFQKEGLDDDLDEGDGEIKAQEFENFKLEKGYPFNTQGEVSKVNRRNSLTEILWNFKESIKIIKNLLETKKSFMNEEINLGRSQKDKQELVLRKQNEYLHQFWLNIVLCHDVITHKKQDSDQLAYQGTSPDEITLLDAAKEIGYIFLDRNSDSMKIEIFGTQKTYRLLYKLEFTSDRKKMSVIVQDQETGMITLFCKGADLAIFDRLSFTIEQPFLDATKEDLIKFSTKGYRTLCFAMRVLDENYFREWQQKYENSKLEMIKLGLGKLKEEVKIEYTPDILQNEIESQLFLLGATALEDKLQDGVPETIEDFHNAGIKVWMLTGDKLETAENIGFSSKMFNEKMYIFKLQTKTKDETRDRLSQIEQKILDIEKCHSTPIVGTQFLLNPQNEQDFLTHTNEQLQQPQNQYNEAKNLIRALEDFRHESRASEYTMNDSWARKPALKRKLRKRLEEIVPDKKAVVNKLIRENQIFYKSQIDQFKYIPSSIDLSTNPYIIRVSNIYRSSQSAKNKPSNKETVDNEDTFGILIEGQTLQYLIDSVSMRKKFLKILSKCQAVVVCRASPSQKGLVVKMIKHSEPDVVTLAIGDGANDVNMIQKAHIGIGIFGKEGYQAAGNSDYAIGQFRFLRRLMFVHGRWSGIRLSHFMLFFFHKNLVFTLPQFCFGWYNGFSGQTFYDDAYLTMFNTIVTAVAICTLAVWDQDINPEDQNYKQLIEIFFPYLYKETQEKDLFSRKKFFVWAAISTLQSILVFSAPILTYDSLMLNDGKTQDMWATSTCAYFSIVFMHYLLIFFATKNWTLWMVFMYLMSFLFFAPFLILTYDKLPNTFLSGRLGEIVFQNIFFWLIILVIVSISLVPLIFYDTAQQLLFPTLKNLILGGYLNKNQILKDLDPVRAKQAHDIFKQRQQQQLNQWKSEYNNFQINKEDNDRNADSNMIFENNQDEQLNKNLERKVGVDEKISIVISESSPDKQFLNSSQRKGLSNSKLQQRNDSKLKLSSFAVQQQQQSQQKENPSKLPLITLNRSDVFDIKKEEIDRINLQIKAPESYRSYKIDDQDISFHTNANLKLQSINDSDLLAADDRKDGILIPLQSERKNPSKQLFL